MFGLLITKLERSLNGPFLVMGSFKVIIPSRLKGLRGPKVSVDQGKRAFVQWPRWSLFRFTSARIVLWKSQIII